MSSNENHDLAALRQHQLQEDIAETVNFCSEYLDRARTETLKGIAEIESLPHQSPSEAEGDAKWRALDALNAVFVHVYRCRQALDQMKIDI